MRAKIKFYTSGHVVKSFGKKTPKIIIHRNVKRLVSWEYWLELMNNNPRNIRAFVLLKGGK